MPLNQLYPEQLGGINLHFQGSGPPHICTKQVSPEAIILVRSQRLGNWVIRYFITTDEKCVSRWKFWMTIHSYRNGIRLLS